jgi:GTP cyclohydrolase I
MEISKKPSQSEAEEAVRTLIKWSGDDPYRDGLRDTPARVVASYNEFFKGYNLDPAEVLKKTFEGIEDYNEIIMLKDIRLESYCEHHILPIIGSATIAYLPNKKIVGISKLARVVEILAKRLQIQERLTVEIARVIDKELEPRGVAVIIEATHQCMTTRGIHKPGTIMKTSHMLGCFKQDKVIRQELFTLINS